LKPPIKNRRFASRPGDELGGCLHIPSTMIELIRATLGKVKASYRVVIETEFKRY
jgi:hypothetical protein